MDMLSNNDLGIEISVGKTLYQPREKVAIDIFFNNKTNDTVPASLAIYEDSVRTINLPEVSVKARRKKKEKWYNNHTPLVADRWISPEDIWNFTLATISTGTIRNVTPLILLTWVLFNQLLSWFYLFKVRFIEATGSYVVRDFKILYH